ncbi:Acetyl esterase/lipase [Halopseudomonas xinjiangensis]|uniref:Acetyl esterase/lipase n=1 Tax=Halopseudomonas xinjiangensis TaxID=487184 RepID=A0A1H1T823_9GAMM|nr:alpha/beta hydrolase [Halopseudomonas xinjiangensis]SDS56291.1 Acetyl esterase/lipase [Halopseudomonas xinjiangensis]
MNVHVDYTAPVSDQPFVRNLLRGSMKSMFRGLIRPPVPIATQRAILRLMTSGMPLAKGVSRTQEVIAGSACEWHRPERADERVMLYLHGGAYLIGSPATHRGICAGIASRSSVSVCVLDYRLAPEYPYPAARDDAVAAYQALLARGYRPSDITLAGDSAGGNLALVTALRLRELELPLPGALVCLSPVVDFTAEHLHEPAVGDPLLNRSWIEQATDAYCPSGMSRKDPGLSPIYGDLAGLPPLLIQVAEDEILLNDSFRLAEKARSAGVSVQLEYYPALWHVFQANTGVLKSADHALDRIAAFLPQTGARVS